MAKLACNEAKVRKRITRHEILSVRKFALEFGDLFEVTPTFVNEEAKTALLSYPEIAYRILGPPEVPIGKVINWIAAWTCSAVRLLESVHKLEFDRSSQSGTVVTINIPSNIYFFQKEGENMINIVKISNLPVIIKETNIILPISGI